jgi:hypothetical protein
MLRMMAYLAAQVGPPRDGVAVRPNPLPEAWERYGEPVWDEWVATIYRASAANEAMSVQEIAVVLTDLCALAVRWMSEDVGFDWTMFEDGRRAAFWNSPSY